MGDLLQFVLQYFSSYSTMKTVYAEYNLYLQVKQRKNLTHLHGNIQTVSEERALKAPYELSLYLQHRAEFQRSH